MTWEAIGAIAAAVVAAFALIFAIRSNGIAKKANAAAAEANRLSGASNLIAKDANKIAEAANTIAAEQKLLATERNDVDWIGDWPEPGLYHLRNRGRDPAHNVHATVWVNGEEKVREADVVGHGEFIEFDFLKAARKRARGVAERKRAAGQSPYPSFDMDVGESVAHRVTWQTPLGGHRVWEPRTYLGEDLGVRSD